MNRLIVIAIAALFTACSPQTAPTAPAPGSLSVAGNWTGNYYSDDGYGGIDFSLTQIGTVVGGTWAIDSTTKTSGTVTGVNQLTGCCSGTFSLTFSQSDPRNCPFSATMTLVTGSNLTGLWVSTNCTKSVSGSVNVYKY